MSDTIAAISTTVGESGIGIVRLSGRDALDIGKKVFNIPHIGFLILVLQSKITSAFIILCLFFYFIYNKKVYEKKKERAIKKKMFNT